MKPDYIAIPREDCYQILEALGNAQELAATVESFATQIEVEDAFGVVRDHLIPDLPSL